MYYLNSINFISHIKGQNLDSYFDWLSAHRIKKVKLYLNLVQPSYFDSFIPELLEIPNLKANLEELEIESSKADYINNFIESWKEYSQFAKFNQVTFICNHFYSKDIFELKTKMMKHFSEFRKNGKWLKFWVQKSTKKVKTY